MAEMNQIYKCEICGNIVEILHAGAGQLVCCNQEMDLLIAGKEDASTEKHVPIVSEGEAGIYVQVGEVSHPMESEHYIEWIEIIYDDGKQERKFLEAGSSPEANFCHKGKIIKVRAYCNLHGLWQA